MATKEEVISLYTNAANKFKEFADAEGVDPADIFEILKDISDQIGQKVKSDWELIPAVKKGVSDGIQRWVRNSFFEGGRTYKPRLDEINNMRDVNVTSWHDSTDTDIAREILVRAGLSSHWKYDELTGYIAGSLSFILDPDKWMNPNFVEPTPENEKAATMAGKAATTTEVVEQMSTTPPAAKTTTTTAKKASS